MAKIIKYSGINSDTGQEHIIWLLRDHTFGRDLRCSTALKSNAVSRFHARISWNGAEWIIRDLGSRNGTYVNGRHLNNGDCKPLKKGDRLHFGDFNEEYILHDDREPGSFLVINDYKNEILIPLTHLLPLPSAEQPLYTVFCDNNKFSVENENGGVISLEHGVSFTVRNTVYLVVLDHKKDDVTQTASSELHSEADSFHLDIAVSPDEESAEITLHKGTEKHVMQPKTHFYLLAYLARLRLENTLNATEDESGWVDCDIICKDLMISREHLAQMVFRIRNEFKTCSPLLAEQIIDRRLRGKLRVGLACAQFTVRAMK